MKEKKLYKIAFMGDKDHGCDIISTLESWGGSNYYLRTGNDPEYVYFINVLGTIDVIHNSKMLSKGMENFYFMFWHDYNIECHLKVGESINYGGQDYDVDGIMFDANNRCIVYVLKLFGIGVEYITNNELTPTEEYQIEEEENNEYLFKNNVGKKLAIKGHSTRGKEVMDLLEMIGGNNIYNFSGDDSYAYYVIRGCQNEIRAGEYIFGDEGVYFFTLEEFLEKYPFKVGDKVIDKADGCPGVVCEMKWDKDVSDMKYCVAFGNGVDFGWFANDSIEFYLNKDNKEMSEMQTKRDMDKTMFMIGPVMVPDKVDDKLEYEIIDGYEFDRVENGKIILKPKYPTTYEECCKVLRISKRVQLSYTYPDVERSNAYLTGEKHLLDAFIKLRICRNAYWKIAGEETGMGKPWEPKFGKTILFDITFYLYKDNFVLHKGEYPSSDNCILVFPTEEMRDAFYENFKDLIEQCKELL